MYNQNKKFSIYKNYWTHGVLYSQLDASQQVKIKVYFQIDNCNFYCLRVIGQI